MSNHCLQLQTMSNLCLQLLVQFYWIWGTLAWGVEEEEAIREEADDEINEIIYDKKD